jgi:DNA-binding transcriptional ArsR family regulator
MTISLSQSFDDPPQARTGLVPGSTPGLPIPPDPRPRLLYRTARGHDEAGRSLILTGDYLVTYLFVVLDDADRVFKALSDPTRRFLLDRLFERDGRTLTELESEVEMTRFGVMKHLRVLEEAGLVVTRRSGREKLHFLNPVPIRLIHDRWIDKYTERQVSALVELKNELENGA